MLVVVDGPMLLKPHPDDVLVDVEARRVWVSPDMWPDDAVTIRKPAKTFAHQ